MGLCISHEVFVVDVSLSDMLSLPSLIEKYHTCNMTTFFLISCSSFDKIFILKYP